MTVQAVATSRSRLAGVLDAVMAQALSAPDESAILAAMGSSLEGIGLHMAVWFVEGNTARLRYSSLPSKTREDGQGITGWPRYGSVVALESLYLHAQHAAVAHLLDGATFLRRLHPDISAESIERITALLTSPQAAVAPLHASNQEIGACVVFGAIRSDDLPYIELWAKTIAGLLMQRRLLVEAHASVRRQAALAALTGDLARASEPQIVLERAVDAAAELLDVHTVAAFMRRADGRGFDVPASHGLAPLEPDTPALTLERSIAGRTVLTRTLQAVDDAAVERAAGIEFPRLAGDVAVGALLVAPIMEREAEPVGVLEVYATESRCWPEEDRELLQALAAACAVALRSARETVRAQREVTRSRTLAALSAALHSADDPDTKLQELVDRTREILVASRVLIMRRSTPDGVLLLTHECAAAAIAPWSELIKGREQPGWTMAETGPGPLTIVAFDDLDEHPQIRQRFGSTIPLDQWPRALLVAPLVEGDRLNGLLIVHQCAEKRHWEEEEIAFVQTLAAQISASWRRHHLLVTTQDDARRLGTLNRIAEALIGAPHFGAMCDRTLVALRTLLDVGRSAIHVYDEAAVPERALRMVAWNGLSAQAVASWTAMPLGMGLTGQAALRREIVSSETLEDTPPDAAATLPTAQQEGVQARMSIPMLARGRLLGTLTIGTTARRAWTAADRSLLQTVANQLAVAFEAEHLRGAAASARAAQEADRLKSELLSTVSHELRTPLGAIKGFTSGLLHFGGKLSAADRLESLQYIDEAADRLAELIDNLLDLQRIDAGRLAVRAEIADLVELATLVRAEMAPRSAQHDIRLETNADMVLIRGDARRLRQVLQNLVENAIKYSPGGGRVTIRIVAGAATVQVRVEDSGVGIPRDQLTRIFERFHRVDNSMTRRIGGTGLGLAIVKALVAAHNGTVCAESAGEGHGSTFVVTLPIATEEDAYGPG